MNLLKLIGKYPKKKLLIAMDIRNFLNMQSAEQKADKILTLSF